MKNEALKLALEALEICEQDGYIPVRLTRDSITAIKQALAAPVQEPVAWIHVDAYQPSNRYLEWKENCKGYEGDWVKHPLYTTPLATPNLQAELDATNRQVEILSDALAESRRQRQSARSAWVGVTLDDREKLRDQFEGWNYPAILVDAVADILKEKNT